MEDLRKMRSGVSLNGNFNNGNKPTPIGKPAMYGSSPSGGPVPKNYSNLMYFPKNSSTKINGNHETSTDLLTSGLSGISLQSPGYPPNGKFSPQFASNHNSASGGVPLGNAMQYMANGQMLFGGNNFSTQSLGQYAGSISPTSGMFNNVGTHFVNHNGYGYHPSNFGENSPNWTTSRTSSGEMPSLVTPRRDSSSSNEHDVPGTPFTSFTSYGHGIPVIDRSPQSICAWSTPSPTQTAYGFGKPSQQSNTPLHLQLLCQQDPAIPQAVPAPFSPMKPLDRALENPHGATNVYIRGLQPNTTDEMLYALASRFGDIISSKSIIDHGTGECKGYGFVKFHNFKDAENCIRGFHHCGYETSFARESFYNQLKKLSDEENTNLYVSNLPKDMNEHELQATFNPHKVCSSRILRNSDGTGRGVGFARFESREACEKVIKEFNNMPIAKTEGEEHLIQIRFADTPEQKALKQQTTAARQYRTAEYESQTQGGNGSFAGSRLNSLNSSAQLGGTAFESFMNMNGHYSPLNMQATAVGLAGRFAARDRLVNVSSHLKPRISSSNINVNLPHTSIIEPDGHATPTSSELNHNASTADTECDQSTIKDDAIA